MAFLTSKPIVFPVVIEQSAALAIQTSRTLFAGIVDLPADQEPADFPPLKLDVLEVTRAGDGFGGPNRQSLLADMFTVYLRHLLPGSEVFQFLLEVELHSPGLAELLSREDEHSVNTAYTLLERGRAAISVKQPDGTPGTIELQFELQYVEGTSASPAQKQASPRDC